MNSEVALISKLIDTGKYEVLVDKQVDKARYFSGRNKKYFKGLQEHFLKYGVVPSHSTFKNMYPSFEFEKDLPEPIEYYCDEVRTKLKHNTIVNGIDDIVDKLNDMSTDNAYDKIKSIVNVVENEIILTDSKLINQNTESRLADYYDRAKAGGMTGILSGIDRLDYMLKGYNPGELVTLIGYTSTGKSWFEIIQAVHIAKSGYKVLFVTTEMSTDMIMRRIDAVWCKLPYNRFRDGSLYPEELERYKEYLEFVEGNEDFNLIVEQATGGVSHIGAKIEQYKPDIVFVDGGYLLEDEQKGDDDWKGLVRIWRGLHRLSLLKKTPIFVSTQSKERKVSLSTISFGKAISNDSDVVLALEQDEQMFNDREIKIKPLKIREGEMSGSIIMNWDFSVPDWSTIYTEGKFDAEPEELRGTQSIRGS